MKRKLHVDSIGDVTDEGGDIVARFASRTDATLFVNADELLRAARDAYLVLNMPIINTPNREELHGNVATRLKLAIARAEGKMP